VLRPTQYSDSIRFEFGLSPISSHQCRKPRPTAIQIAEINSTQCRYQQVTAYRLSGIIPALAHSHLPQNGCVYFAINLPHVMQYQTTELIARPDINQTKPSTSSSCVHTDTPLHCRDEIILGIPMGPVDPVGFPWEWESLG